MDESIDEWLAVDCCRLDSIECLKIGLYTGLAVGMALLNLRWRVKGIMLAGCPGYYEEQQHRLLSAFKEAFDTGKPRVKVKRTKLCQ